MDDMHSYSKYRGPKGKIIHETENPHDFLALLRKLSIHRVEDFRRNGNDTELVAEGPITEIELDGGACVTFASKRYFRQMSLADFMRASHGRCMDWGERYLTTVEFMDGRVLRLYGDGEVEPNKRTICQAKQRARQRRREEYYVIFGRCTGGVFPPSLAQQSHRETTMKKKSRYRRLFRWLRSST